VYYNSGSLNDVAWGSYDVVLRPTAALWISIITNAPGAAGITLYDTVSAKPLTFSDLITCEDYGVAKAHVSAALTVTANKPCGVIACCDDPDNPQNYLLAWHDRTNAHLDKCVAGTITSLINTAATYDAGTKIKIRVGAGAATNVALFYDDALIGAEQTVSDAGIISNTYHGIFSTSSDSPVDTFEVYPTEISGSALAELRRYAE